jgi:uncharacterized protein (DUF302 family)
MTVQTDGLASIRSSYPVDETVAHIEAILREKGVKVFEVIDHGGEAKQAGLEMRPAKVVIFGNPRAGTPLMVAAPSTAIDLPLKLLVWEDADARCGSRGIRRSTCRSGMDFRAS